MPPLLMTSTQDTWYYLTAGNFYDNHIRPALGLEQAGKAKDDALVDAVLKAVRNRQGAAGAATTRNTVIYKVRSETEPLKLLVKKALEAAVATGPQFAQDGSCAAHFTSADTFRIVTVVVDPAKGNKYADHSIVEQPLRFMIAKYAIDKKCRIMHYG